MKEDASARWTLLEEDEDGEKTITKSRKNQVLLYTILVVLFFIIFYFTIFIDDGKTEQSVTETTTTVTMNVENVTEIEDPLFAFNSSDCPYEEWNTIRTTEIPHADLHAEWAKKNLSNFPYLWHDLPSVLAAFVYKDQVTVTLSSENQYNVSVFCRYYDCRRREINDPFPSVIYPVSTVFCARRPGAKYISVSKTLNETVEYSVPIVPRLEKPPHYFTVCMSPLYGDEPKFLQIVDFIEYYKLQGATFFHIYVRNVTDYDKLLLDDYVRTGDIEIIRMHDHFWRADFMWHNAQINDCHHRNKYFSKWTALIDPDERIEMRTEKYRTIADYLDSVHNPSIVNLHFRVSWVIKGENTPARYENEEQLSREMLFHKYKNMSQPGGDWDQPKTIIRPEQVFAMHIHVPFAVYSGVKYTIVDPSVGVVRHYRATEQRVFNTALAAMMSHAPFHIDDIPKWLDDELTKAIMRRVQWVYDIPELPCIKKQQMYWVHGNIDSECWLEEKRKNESLTQKS